MYYESIIGLYICSAVVHVSKVETMLSFMRLAVLGKEAPNRYDVALFNDNMTIFIM